MHEDYLEEDYKNEVDEYVKLLDAHTKKSILLKIGMGSLYIFLLVASLFVM